MELAAMSCRTLLVVVFAVAVTGKAGGAESFGAFVRSVQEFVRSTSPNRGRGVAHLVIGAEVAGTVLLLLPGPAAVAGFALVGCLLGAFALAIATSLRRGVRVPCRCFGASASSAGPLELVRNGFLMAAAVTGAVGTSNGLPETTGAVALAVGTGLILGVVVTVLDDISDLLRDAVPVAIWKGRR
ncbi:MauE/DoxX family redox-associated membrane protein [Streptomyces sp. NPDC057686]|uniref:MauE/DoxX family redox-associated membrane protein n=1 Tax=Streptomyces sp. NPDC057686 TaxID=3346212 RepID=UPI0036AC5754